MRIALYHNLPSGGAKRTLLEATRRLTQRHEVDAYTLESGDHDFADIRPYLRRHLVFPFRPGPLFAPPFGRLNQISRCIDLIRLRRVARRVAAVIDGRGYDVALVHPCRFEQSPSVLRYLRTKTVYYCHEPRRLSYETMPSRPYDDNSNPRRRLMNRLDPLPNVYRRMARRIDEANLRSASAVLVNSKFTARAVARAYDVQAVVSYHGVDTTQFRPTGQAKRHMVLSVGSLTPLKGFDFLVRVVADVSEDVRPSLVIVSNFQNADERGYVEELATRLGVQLELRSAVDEPELVRLYNEARIVAYAPVGEPFGLVPLEAMACGTPVVGVNEGGIGESVVDGFSGLLVERDHRRFADAIRWLLQDSTAAARLGAQGRSHALQHWTWERAVDSLEHSLHNTAEPRGVAPAIPTLAH